MAQYISRQLKHLYGSIR